MKEITKSHVSTREGQMELSNSALSRSSALLLARKIRSIGGDGWPDAIIESADPVLLAAIKGDLIREYNKLVSA